MLAQATHAGRARHPSLALCADECGARCCRSRLVKLSVEEAWSFTARGAPVAQGTDGSWAMLAIPQCHFLGERNACTIYPHRPAACRAYPTRPSPGCLVWPKETA